MKNPRRNRGPFVGATGGISRITIGRGNAARFFNPPTDKVGREQAADDLKKYLGRGNLIRNQQAARARA
jgi:hypothetical protein